MKFGEQACCAGYAQTFPDAILPIGKIYILIKIDITLEMIMLFLCIIYYVLRIGIQVYMYTSTKRHKYTSTKVHHYTISLVSNYISVQVTIVKLYNIAITQV